MGFARIDTHVHFVVPTLLAGIEKAGGDPSGWKAPDWSPETHLELMDKWQIQTSVLSITSPGPAVLGIGKESNALARKLNEEAAELTKKYPGRFEFFSSVGDFCDVEGTIAEIEYGLKLGASGVVVMTSYSNKLLGDLMFKPIWDKLDELKAVVFIHPASVDIKPKLTGNLPQPTIDYPQQTTRTAIDLVMTKTFSSHPNVKIILSHGGGTLAYLSDRVLKSLDMAQVSKAVGMTSAEAKRDFQRFYLDLAVSTHKGQLLCLMEFTKPSQILFGSDYPYAIAELATRTTEQLDAAMAENKEIAEFFKDSHNVNAKRLFGWK